MQDKVDYEKRTKNNKFEIFYFNKFFFLGVREQAARFRATDI